MLILTNGSRLARSLTAAEAQRHLRAGRAAWETPSILSYAAWLNRQWDERVLTATARLPILLSPLAERLLWEQIVDDSRSGSGLIDRSAAARLAAEAYAMVRAHRMPTDAGFYHSTDDAEAFHGWQQKFIAACEASFWLSLASLPDQLAPGSTPISLAGFDELTPQQDRLLAKATKHPGAALQTEAIARLFPDPDEERFAAADWAAKILATEPNATVAIIAFGLESSRLEWNQALTAALGPRYSLAAGAPLSTLPIPASALRLLDLLAPEIPTAAASEILLSPYLAAATEERSGRARLDAKLRSRSGPAILTSRLTEHDLCPELHRRLHAALHKHQGPLPSRAPSTWAREFHHLLDDLGWPGDARLNAEEFPVFEEWREALTRFASLDSVCGTIPFRQAQSLLTDIVTETRYEPPPARLQLLPAPTPLGAPFDHLWLAGATDAAWPPPLRLNPLVPIAAQREYRVPRNTAAATHSWARHWTRDVLQSASRITISAPARSKDDILRPSRLFAATFSSAGARVHPTPTGPLETLSDELAPPPAAAPEFGGGTTLFKLQSQCPFHAFAQLRLGARELEDPPFGYDARGLGTLLHKAIELCWKEIKNHATLDKLNREGIAQIAANAVSRALDDRWRERTGLHQRMRDVEQTRLTQTLVRWLEYERGRKPFTVIETEAERTATVAGLTVNIRTDRVDSLPDGRLVLIDYKSTAPDAKAWAQTAPNGRLAEPQLPLYAITSTAPVAAIAFAQLDPAELRFKGAMADKQLLPNIQFQSNRPKLDQDMLDFWNASLSAAAGEYLRGEARVDPIPGACDFCHLEALCRIHELRAGPTEEDEDGD